MALRFTTSSIHAKLDDLTLGSPRLSPQDSISPKIEPFSTKSLLSKSLASEGSMHENEPPSPLLLANIDLSHLRDDHPEPSLLATSVGKDSEGRMLPSSSTISLLSLSNNAHGTNGNSSTTNMVSALSNFSNMTGNPPNYIDLHFNHNKLVPQTFTPTSIERGNSFSNLRSRNSFNHLGQQRLQPYQKMTSPGIPSGSEFASITSPQNIPLKRNLSSVFTPSSPSLDPVSVANSPSGFWLNSQTPPRISNSLGKYKSSANQFVGLHQINSIGGTLNIQEKQGSLHLTSKHIDIQRKGSDSPILNPVQTPIEDMPMTPLYLNSDSDSYFVLSNTQGASRTRTSVSYGFETAEGIDENEELDEMDNLEKMD